ncbi:hypothetical protein [uncultured Xanthomonas sp.]|uniref:hypothetical protein n=1 Tax=uncultured Xanthomonas sp. TaxID=152831 RepID=UPI0025D99ABA|nr:hypothetical protein [uncultured Xanthomonas sp.]
MNTDFDPIDLAMLVRGWVAGAAPRDELSIDRAEQLQRVAVLLQQLYTEIDEDEWDRVWAYEVAAPLGQWIGERFVAARQMPSMEDVERAARGLIAD